MPAQDPETKLEEQNSLLQDNLEAQSHTEGTSNQPEQDYESDRRTTYFDTESSPFEDLRDMGEQFQIEVQKEAAKPDSEHKLDSKAFRESYKSLFSHPFFAPLKHKADHEIINVLDSLDIDLNTDDSDVNLTRYCEDFSDLNPNHDYYRYMKLGENVVT